MPLQAPPVIRGRQHPQMTQPPPIGVPFTIERYCI
jgi:hypothetical protein